MKIKGLDNIAYIVAFVVAVIAMWNGESIPTLWMATGCQKLTRLLKYLLSEVSRASEGVKPTLFLSTNNESGKNDLHKLTSKEFRRSKMNEY